MRAPTEQVISISRLICVGCGSETNATCNCGMEYRPKAVRAAEAIAAAPEKSNRAIAEETGLSEPTIRRARASHDAPESVTGRDGKQYPARRTEPEILEPDDEEPPGPPQWLGDDADSEECIDDDYADLVVERNKLQRRVSDLTEALNAKEVTASRNWPADMKPKQIKKRDDYLKNIAWWQRELEKLYAEVTGQPPWRVVLNDKSGARCGNGVRLATRGEAESYGQTAAREEEGTQFEILPCENETAICNSWVRRSTFLTATAHY
jgi:hypothetical protein